MGIGPMQSLAKIAVVDGKPTLASETQRALILQAGHEMWVEEATSTKVTVAGKRRNSDQTSRITWTMDDARRANLAGRPAWKLYPRQMLLARASAELARAMFADAIGGLAATEEIEEQGTVPESERRARAEEDARERKRIDEPQRDRIGERRARQPPGAQGRRSPVKRAHRRSTSSWRWSRQRMEAALKEELERRGGGHLRGAGEEVDGAHAREEGDDAGGPARLLLASWRAGTSESSSDLTMEEASKVIDALEQWNPEDPQVAAVPGDGRLDERALDRRPQLGEVPALQRPQPGLDQVASGPRT